MHKTMATIALALAAGLALVSCGSSAAKSVQTTSGGNVTSASSGGTTATTKGGAQPSGCADLKAHNGSCMTIAISGAVTKSLVTTGTAGIGGQTCADWAANTKNSTSQDPTWFHLPTPTGAALTQLSTYFAISDYKGPGTFGADRVTGNTGGQMTVGTQSFKFDSASSTASVTVNADGSGSAKLGGMKDAGSGATSADLSITWTCVG